MPLFINKYNTNRRLVTLAGDHAAKGVGHDIRVEGLASGRCGGHGDDHKEQKCTKLPLPPPFYTCAACLGHEGSNRRADLLLYMNTVQPFMRV